MLGRFINLQYINLQFCQSFFKSIYHFTNLQFLSTYHYSTHHAINLFFINLPFHQLASLPFGSFVNVPLCQLAILSIWVFHQFTISPIYSFLSTYHYSTRHFINFFITLPFHQNGNILPICDFVKVQYCQLAISSTCHFSNLFFINFSFHQLAVLSTCHFIILLFHQIAISLPSSVSFSSNYHITCSFVTLPFHQLILWNYCFINFLFCDFVVLSI